MAKESLAAKVAREAKERLAKIEARRKGFKAPMAVRGDVISSRPSGKGRESSLTKGGKDVLSTIGKIKKPKKKKADPWIDPGSLDKKKGKTPKAKTPKAKTPKAKTETKKAPKVDPKHILQDDPKTAPSPKAEDYSYGSDDPGPSFDPVQFDDSYYGYDDPGASFDSWEEPDYSYGSDDPGASFDSSWSWDDTGWKHGGRIKKAKKAKAKSRKSRSRPAIRGRRRELKGS
jgi:hypothetical protein